LSGVQVPEACMIDREKVLAVLRKRFPGAAADQVAAAANAIVGLADEWEDVTDREPGLGFRDTEPCGESCFLAEQTRAGVEVRVFVRRGEPRPAR